MARSAKIGRFDTEGETRGHLPPLVPIYWDNSRSGILADLLRAVLHIGTHGTLCPQGPMVMA